MVDFVKRTYDDLIDGVTGWDQVTYPATIQYKDHLQKHELDIPILIEVQSGTILTDNYGQLSSDPQHDMPIIHVWITYRNRAASLLTNQQYLYTLRTAFRTWFASKNYTDCKIIQQFPNYKKIQYDIWIRCWEMV